MATKKCSQCAEMVQRDAKVCRFCGHQFPEDPARPKRNKGLIALGCVVAVGLVGVALQTPPPQTGTPAAAEQKSTWTYSTDADAMRGQSQKAASLESSNSLDFDFPYNGGARGTLYVRQSPRIGFNISLEMDKGQFMCHAYSGGHISVKFDARSIERFRCRDTSDGSTNVIFIDNPKRFLTELRQSSSLMIEAEFFHEGLRQLTFDSAGLKWPQPS